MAKVLGFFCNSRLPLSPLIRAVTWGRWSHVALSLDGGETVYEATGQHGVTLTPVSALIARSSEFRVVEIDVPDEVVPRLKAEAIKELGKGYDWMGIFGIAIHRDWQNDQDWWCSEYFAIIFQRAGTPLVRAEAVHRVTPQDIWKLPFPTIPWSTS